MITNESFQQFLKHFQKRKEINSEVVNKYCSIYAQAEELCEQREALKDLIKEIMLKDRMEVASFPECPMLLELTIAAQTSVDRERIITSLAKALYGKSYRKNSNFKRLVSRNTARTTVEKLQAPKANPIFVKGK